VQLALFVLYHTLPDGDSDDPWLYFLTQQDVLDVAVNTDAQLTKISQKCGWPIMQLRRKQAVAVL